ncbi:hypothetical protein HN419_06380 [Candidatus Woesearchaeota archaeon]|jgi:hypothetical protein|nr:hypothetical protein [Candidatus Woesearchaeota archaeon]MBT3538121.1 hypothetical protein [Candidatus Woesearchaeota archaeon]MBT4697520.1 hypothetical protein [Candidatus Woesearchaeota archaeon]MBT4717367.1 hypothetical protein [Candidatus Woesearchaeota archaeon]MBT7105790.1 hypothetical protein [Candidatus Woesearchaeota archaeon]
MGMFSSNGKDVTIRFGERTVIGLTEKVIIKSLDGKEKEVLARIDTGATTSSVDVGLAAELGLGPVIKSKLIKSASGSGMRAVVKAIMVMENQDKECEFNLADRTHMKYRVLIGQNILKDGGFLIDPTKSQID